MAVWDERRVFVDTNILLYAMDRDAGAKHERARGVVERIWSARTGVISTQILSESIVNLRRKLELDWTSWTGNAAAPSSSLILPGRWW